MISLDIFTEEKSPPNDPKNLPLASEDSTISVAPRFDYGFFINGPFGTKVQEWELSPISIILKYVVKVITLSNVVKVLVGGHCLLKS
ncbi:hypothetical protein RF55_17761 [Lasius niger]|uniref:Uncharacterized protein n=1 Tax=Lasius niger TaxID=67767 RepID=A0A0J7MVC1_LASNI|nr:hypothetical protein RF55_17761 [Lasius niger]